MLHHEMQYCTASNCGSGPTTSMGPCIVSTSPSAFGPPYIPGPGPMLNGIPPYGMMQMPMAPYMMHPTPPMAMMQQQQPSTSRQQPIMMPQPRHYTVDDIPPPPYDGINHGKRTSPSAQLLDTNYSPPGAVMQQMQHQPHQRQLQHNALMEMQQGSNMQMIMQGAGEQQPRHHLSPHSPNSSTASTSSAVASNATATDPCSSIIHVLQCYQQGGEDADFVKKAVESLVKKVKDKRHELDALIVAITSGGKTPTPCVTIQRSLDGRLQVAGRKGVPHVVYARIWRWPNVSKNELQKLPACAIPMDHGDLICVNPYHYERVVSSSAIGNLDLSNLRLENAAILNNTSHGPPSLSSCALEDSPPWLSPCAVASGNSQLGQSVLGASPFDVNRSGYHPGIEQNLLQPTAPPLVMNAVHPSRTLASNCGYFNLDTVQIPYLPNVAEHWCSITYYELDTQVGETFKVRKDQQQVTIDGGVHPAGARDGRFCLGALPNLHRGEASERARLHIGKGVKLTYNRDDGSVVLDCLSEKAIFVRSYYLDFINQRNYGSIVHRIASGTAGMKIFDLRWAYEEMRRQSESAQMAVVAQAAAVAGYAHGPAMPASLIEHAGTGVDDLRRVCCTLAFSFVKGYGENYNRKTIKETPCWVEVQLHRPLQLLDQVLHKLQGSESC